MVVFEQFAARQSAHGTMQLLALAGELDVATLPQLQPLLEDVVGRASPDAVIDLSDVSLLACSVVHELLHANRRLRRRGGRLALSSPPPDVHRLLQLTNTSDQLPVCDCVADAHTLLTRQ